MRFKIPKNTGRFYWTEHSIGKMIFYGLSEQKIKRVIEYPERTEEGIAPRTVACMQASGSKKRRSEIWIMYQIKNQKSKTGDQKFTAAKKLTIISVWRYPGKSPAKNPIPGEILEEIKGYLR